MVTLADSLLKQNSLSEAKKFINKALELPIGLDTDSHISLLWKLSHAYELESKFDSMLLCDENGLNEMQSLSYRDDLIEARLKRQKAV